MELAAGSRRGSHPPRGPCYSRGMDSLVETVQQLVDGKWRHVPKARAACASGAAALTRFVDETAPAAPILIGRSAHRACRDAAIAAFTGPRLVTIDLVPVWVGDNEGEEASPQWYCAHAMRVGDGDWGVLETGPIVEDAAPALTSVANARARMWTVGSVVLSQYYAPGIALLQRKGSFGAVASDIFEVLEVTTTPGESLERPTLDVPPFSHWVAPRVSGLPDTCLEALRKLSFTADSEGGIHQGSGPPTMK